MKNKKQSVVVSKDKQKGKIDLSMDYANQRVDNHWSKNDNESLVVIRQDIENGKIEQVSMEYAIQRLDGYWIKEHIKPMLLKGDSLWTPFAYYSIKADTVKLTSSILKNFYGSVKKVLLPEDKNVDGFPEIQIYKNGDLWDFEKIFKKPTLKDLEKLIEKYKDADELYLRIWDDEYNGYYDSASLHDYTLLIYKK